MFYIFSLYSLMLAILNSSSANFEFCYVITSVMQVAPFLNLCNLKWLACLSSL